MYSICAQTFVFKYNMNGLKTCQSKVSFRFRTKHKTTSQRYQLWNTPSSVLHANICIDIILINILMRLSVLERCTITTHLNLWRNVCIFDKQVDVVSCKTDHIVMVFDNKICLNYVVSQSAVTVTSAGGLLVTVRITRPVVGTSALIWCIRYM